MMTGYWLLRGGLSHEGGCHCCDQDDRCSETQQRDDGRPATHG
jgi:hypothetical protein